MRYYTYMKTHLKSSGGCRFNLCFLLLPLLLGANAFAQEKPMGTAKADLPKTVSLRASSGLGNAEVFIQNIGQYGDSLKGFSPMGKLLYGYEGLNMPVLITPKGLIHLQRKTDKISLEEMRVLRQKGWKEKDILQANSITRTISMEWVNANPDPAVITEEKTDHYISFLFLKEKATTFRKITFKELYPGIDLVYSIDENQKNGFEYSLVAQPGADLSKVKIRYGGDLKTIRRTPNGSLVVSSGIEDITVSVPQCYYADDREQKFGASFQVDNYAVRFNLPANYNRNRKTVIDPFVSGTGTLTGSDAGKAKDVDFDYAGNIYVVGGGDGSIQRLSKYNAAGTLQWTFNGSLNSPCWEFGTCHGGWAVDKNNGNIYLGQGINENGFKIIRLDENGLYDNYMMDAGNDFTQNWKMVWNCNSGNASIYIAGGGGTGGGNTSNVELIRFSPAQHAFTPVNITGVNTGNTDISDLVTDPANGNLYTIFSTSILDPAEDNKLFKHQPPYTHDHISWSVNTGCHALHEPVNRPYLSGIDNSSNTIAINAQYLFYWDGKNLKAFKKTDGTMTGNPVTISSNQLLMQGGIVADECNNVYVGSVNGTIKTYHFTGSGFDDDAVADITVPNYTNRSVYDLAYNPERNLLYASGNGFVASFDLSANCNIGTTYTMNINPGCSATAVSAVLNPAPPSGSNILFSLYEGNTLITSNSSGVFNNLTDGKLYHLTALINQTCSGNNASVDFTAQAPATVKINTPAGVCSGNSFDLTAASLTQGSTPGMTFSYWMDAAASISVPDPAKVPAGDYYLKAIAPGGCSYISPVKIKALARPQAVAGMDTVVCSGSNYRLTGSGGSEYYWSPSTYLSNATIANPLISNPGITGSITYHLKVKDANGCESNTSDEVKVSFAAPAAIFIDTDSAVAIDQPLQLNVIDQNHSGFTDYRWSPVYGLNNPFIKDPVARLDKEMTYTVKATNKYQCTATASITIKVFRGPEIYVPNSFTPNGDGLNDVLRPIPVGLVEFHYLKIFDRFGHLLCSITDPSRGWDGRLQGVEQNSGTYVWIAEGIDYKGNLIMRKGYSTLLR